MRTLLHIAVSSLALAAFAPKLFPNPGYAASWGVTISGAMELGLLMWGARRIGVLRGLQFVHTALHQAVDGLGIGLQFAQHQFFGNVHGQPLERFIKGFGLLAQACNRFAHLGHQMANLLQPLAAGVFDLGAQSGFGTGFAFASALCQALFKSLRTDLFGLLLVHMGGLRCLCQQGHCKG